ncbi:MAG: hypothetical protein NTU74_21470, partial [Deltaproteobacteria bacterium]|nr:hypothetical protein [Deltaproteobacteria bacterium]
SEYDLVGNLIKTINATSMQTGYQYDALHRLLSVTEAGIATAGYAYDAHGNVIQVTDAKSKVTSFTYDDFGRKVSGVVRTPDLQPTATMSRAILSRPPMQRVRSRDLPTMP